MDGTPESDIRQRCPQGDSSNTEAKDPQLAAGDEKQEVVGPDINATKNLSQGTDHTPTALKSVLEILPPRWQNWVVRFITTFMMIGAFTFIIYLGPLALVLLVLAIQLMCYYEIINIGYIVYRSQDLPGFRTLSWYFLFTSNYFLFGESLIDRFRILLAKEDFLQPLVTHHRFISFSLYCGGVVGFVLTLVKKHYLQQFTLFGWTHVTLLIIVTSSHCIMKNIFNGIIWFLIPVSMIITNDIMAYVFGFFFGKTPLIKLSPKKTWEGFIGGGLSTLVFSLLFARLLITSDYFVCPIEYDDSLGALSMECIRNPVFQPIVYDVPKWLFFLPFGQFQWYPYYSHCLLLSTFASVVGPFGGFFASGFKRAFNIKDFGDLIPGHGGIMDRFDCQVLMGAFVALYYESFIRIPSISALLQQIFVLTPVEQLEFYNQLTEGLVRRGILNSTSFPGV